MDGMLCFGSKSKRVQGENPFYEIYRRDSFGRFVVAPATDHVVQAMEYSDVISIFINLLELGTLWLVNFYSLLNFTVNNNELYQIITYYFCSVILVLKFILRFI